MRLGLLFIGLAAISWGAAVAALLAICSAPLMIAMLAALGLGERIEPVVKASLGTS